jgi:hypothetical protein
MNSSHLLVALKDVGIVQDLVPQIEECYQENLAAVAILEAQLVQIDVEQARLDCTRDILDYRRLDHARELRLERIRNLTNRAAIDALQRDVTALYEYVSTSDKYAYAQHAAPPSLSPLPTAAATVESPSEPTHPLADVWNAPQDADADADAAAAPTMECAGPLPPPPSDTYANMIVVSDDEDEEDEELTVTRLLQHNRKRPRSSPAISIEAIAAAERSIDEQLGLALPEEQSYYDDKDNDNQRDIKRVRFNHDEQSATATTTHAMDLSTDYSTTTEAPSSPPPPMETYEEHHARMIEIIKRRNLLEEVLATPCYNLRQFCPNKKCGRPYINVQVGGNMCCARLHRVRRFAPCELAHFPLPPRERLANSPSWCVACARTRTRAPL